MTTQPVEIETIEGEDVYLVARPESPSGEVLTRAEVSAAVLSVYEEGVSTVAYTRALSIGSVNPPGGSYNNCMFSSLQTDGWWDLQGGYTFWAMIGYSAFAMEGGKSYRIEVKLTAGHTGTVVWPNLGAYGDLMFVWTTTPQAVGSL